MEALKSLEDPCINKFAKIVMSTSVLWHNWKFVLCLQLSFNQPGKPDVRINGGMLLVPGGMGTWGCQYLGVLVPGGVDTWGKDPWNCRYLGVQVPGILAPKDAGTRDVGTWGQW